MRDFNGYPTREREEERQLIVQNLTVDVQPATTTKLGGVIVGNGLQVATDGNLSLSGIAGATNGQFPIKSTNGLTWTNQPDLTQYYTKTQVDGLIGEVSDDLDEHTENTDIHTSPSEKATWSAKYNKPANGIPSTDMTSAVQTSLAKADTALQEHQSLASYSLISETGNKLELELDETDYKLVAKLYDKNNNLLSTSAEIDLPIESLIVSISYDSATKELVITLKNGTITRIPIGSIITGLATQDWVTATFATQTSVAGAIANAHTHANKTILDGITSDKITSWDGKYAKPNGGIPSSDMSSAVQTSLGKADSALQEHQSLSAYRTAAAQDTIDATKQDKLTAGTNIEISNTNTISAKTNAYNYIKQIADYLFEVQYSTENIDYNFANQYFKSPAVDSLGAGGCTGVVKDQRVLRQLDWYYNDNAEFIVRRKADPEKGILASIGVSSSIKGLTKSFVEGGTYSQKYKILPFVITDGINEEGLYIQSNVVPALSGGFDINPTATNECCITMVARYILDYCKNFSDVEAFFNTYHIYSTSAITYGCHFLLAKGNQWEVIEITSNGHITVTQGAETNQMPHGIISNFRTTGLIFSDDEVDWNTIEEYGLGVERFDIATTAFTESVSFDDLREDLKYTNLYTNTQTNVRWNTDYCGERGVSGYKLKVMDAKTSPEEFNQIFQVNAEAYENRSRYEANPTTWQTTHSAIYDLVNKRFNISIQERLTESYDFSLDENFIDLSLYRTASAQDLIDATKYVKPATGIPQTDLSSGVQTSLAKADTALQEHQSLAAYRTSAAQDVIDTTKYVKPTGGIPSTDMSSAVQTSLGKADTALQEHQSLSAYRTSAAQDVIDNGKQPTISDLTTIRSGAALGATALQAVPNTYRTSADQDTIDAGLQSNINDRVKYTDIKDNVTSTSTSNPLSANQGKLLNDRINNLEAIGRFLAIWNCATGLPLTNPTTLPYTYKTGDYYRIGTVGTTSYKPSGNQYTGVASTTVAAETDIHTGDLWVYDGTIWSLSINHLGAFVQEVNVNGTSVVSAGVANVTVPTKISDLTNDSNFVPNTRKINGNALSADITLSAADVGADASGTAATLVGGLATIASTGNVNNLVQTSGDELILDGGSST